MKQQLFYIILTLITILVVLSCKKEIEHTDSNKERKEKILDSCDCEIKSITALYYNYLFNSARARNWDDLILNIPNFEKKSNGILDASISDCRILKEIETELKTLKPSEEQRGGADIRILLTIHYKNKNDTTLCIGGYYAEGIFTKDRIELKSENTNKLLFLTKNNIGYYSWFNKMELEHMDELKDTIFIKEPFIESSYYKLYEKMKANEN